MRRPGILALLLFAGAAALPAWVTDVDIQSRKDIWNDRYELSAGRVYFSLYPANRHDSVIVDLDKAPRNAQGEVELPSDLPDLLRAGVTRWEFATQPATAVGGE